MNIPFFSVWQPEPVGVIQQCFPHIYTFLVLYTIVGMIYQVLHLVRVPFLRERPMFMWRTRIFFMLKDLSKRQIRSIGGMIMIIYWIMLFYGLATIKTSVLTPWLYISFIIMMLDYLMWYLELIYTQQHLNWYFLISFVLPLSVHLLVRRVQLLIEISNRSASKRWFF